MEIIGEAYRELQGLVKDYAKADAPVLFIGETGIGKELFMQLYMKENPRVCKKMTVNCAAFSDELLRSEVFGHEKGAFTGAVKKRDGKVTLCDKGILALDEIGDATPGFQAMILRVSEGNSYSPLGSNVEITDTNTLIIAATNKPENLRHDLKQRFHIIPIPPLQKEDIPLLARHFLKKPLSKKLIMELKARKYNGNIRELKRVCDELVIEKRRDIFSVKDPYIAQYHFDYDRFRREFATWNCYIQPIINKYGDEYAFQRYKYEYQRWKRNPIKWIQYRDDNLNPSALKNKVLPNEDYTWITTYWEMYEMILYLKKKIGEGDDFSINGEGNLPLNMDERRNKFPRNIERFKELMRTILDKSILPCLLGYIYLKAETPRLGSVTGPEAPFLENLLDMPLKQAEKAFAKHYYDYNVEKYPDLKTFKKEVGIEKKSLAERFTRHKKNEQNK